MGIALFFFIVAGSHTAKKDSVFSVQIPVFEKKTYIPSEYTCDGKNISPEVLFKNTPEKARSIALIADDPDAPMGTWVHWVVYNIPPDSTHLPENFPKKLKVGKICQGINDFGKYGYGGPCPPSGVHRYFFKVYVLDTVFECREKITKKKLLELIKGHVIASDTVMRRYRRKKK